jgi:hypothetical protein
MKSHEILYRMLHLQHSERKKDTQWAGGMEFSLCKLRLLLHHCSKLYVYVIIVYGDAKIYPNQHIIQDGVMVCSCFNMKESTDDTCPVRLMWPSIK